MKLSTLTKSVKLYAKNPSESAEKFFNDFLYPYIWAGKLMKNKTDELHYDKQETSRLMNGIADVPVKLRKALKQYGIREKTAVGMADFVEDSINPAVYLQLKGHLLQLIQKDPNISEPDKILLAEKQEDIPFLLTELLLRSFSESNIASDAGKIIWKNGRNIAEVIIGDLFCFGFGNQDPKMKNIVVIPVNTGFDTQVTRSFEGVRYPLVSEHTLHGEWLDRFFKTGETEADLDKRITRSLSCLGFAPIETKARENGKTVSYPLGSVAVIETSNAVYFLLAIAEFDERNVARSRPENIEIALSSLLQVYNEKGQGYSMYIPLMGTGRSRTGMSIQDAYEMMKSCIVRNKHLIQGHVYLVISRDNLSEIEEGNYLGV